MKLFPLCRGAFIITLKSFLAEEVTVTDKGKHLIYTMLFFHYFDALCICLFCIVQPVIAISSDNTASTFSLICLALCVCV